MSLANVAKGVARNLRQCEMRVAFAESCTAGVVSAALSRVPGISQWHCGSAVTYRDATKAGWLGVDQDDLKNVGAVSETVAGQMATGVLRKTPEADLALSVTGHLGPDAPPELDGRVFAGTARREPGAAAQLLHVVDWKLTERTRLSRQKEAAVKVLSLLQQRLDIELAQLRRVLPDADWFDLIRANVDAVCLEGPATERRGGEQQRYSSGVIFPGAFNPLHEGHRRMAAVASQLLGAPTEFELSLINVDKHPLRRFEATRRAAQLQAHGSVWLTRAATFAEKAELFPGAVFVVGADTMARIAHPRYYGDDDGRLDACVNALADHGCRFLFFGRTLDGVFHTLDALSLPERLAALCDEVPPEQFRVDVCSTDLRGRHDEES